jgi:hypothetical protein
MGNTAAKSRVVGRAIERAVAEAEPALAAKTPTPIVERAEVRPQVDASTPIRITEGSKMEATGRLASETEGVGAQGSGANGAGEATVGQRVYGPHYEQAKQLHAQNPDFFPKPDAAGTSVVSGTELLAARREYQVAAQQGTLQQGHHIQGLAFGGQNIQKNIIFTGESTIRASALDGLDLSFYKEAGYGKANAQIFKVYQETPGGVFQFGLNPRHTEATVFQNQVLKWQREQGIR